MGMKIGYMMMLSNWHENMPDAEMVRNEMKMAELAEEVGYDVIWCPEHHFANYSMAVDNHMILAYLAGRTKTIKLGTAVIILPWWTQPIRIAEKISMMDAMTNGRYLIGFGRGLARHEFEVFNIPMDETRSRFDEMSKMLLKALETGFIEGDGPHFPQIKTEIRPRPSVDLKDRLYAVGMSPDSAVVVGELGAKLMQFIQFSMDKHLPNLLGYREAFQRTHKKPAPPPLYIDFCYCDKDAGRAEEMARKHLAVNYLSILKHYEFMADYHKEIKGYEAYGQAASFLNSLGMEAAVNDYITHQAWGTPQQILDKLEKRRTIVGDFEWNSIVSYGGMPYDAAEKSMRLIGKEVMPEIRKWKPIEVKAAA